MPYAECPRLGRTHADFCKLHRADAAAEAGNVPGVLGD